MLQLYGHFCWYNCGFCAYKYLILFTSTVNSRKKKKECISDQVDIRTVIYGTNNFVYLVFKFRSKLVKNKWNLKPFKKTKKQKLSWRLGYAHMHTFKIQLQKQLNLYLGKYEKKLPRSFQIISISKSWASNTVLWNS